MVHTSGPKSGEGKSNPETHSAPRTASPERVSPGTLTLCAGCNTVVRLTDAQAVVAEAELIALDVVSLAFCRGCRGKVA